MILGTAQLGLQYGINNGTGQPSVTQAMEILDCAWHNGITTLDTAGAYGNAEYIIGRYQKETGNRFKICTKTTGNDNRTIEESLQVSLENLQTASVWLYYLHRYEACKDPQVIEKLQRLKREGRIQKIGVSLYEPIELQDVIERLQGVVDIVQIPFNLLDHARWMADGLLQRSHEQGIAVFARSVYLQGLFFKDPDDVVARDLSVSHALTVLRRLAAEKHITLQQLAIAFLRCQPDVEDFLIGCETVEQLRQSAALAAAAGETAITAEEYALLLQLSQAMDARSIDPRQWH